MQSAGEEGFEVLRVMFAMEALMRASVSGEASLVKEGLDLEMLGCCVVIKQKQPHVCKCSRNISSITKWRKRPGT